MIKGEKTEQRAKQKKEPLSCLSCGPPGSALSPDCGVMFCSWSCAADGRVDMAVELPSLSGDS